MKEVFIKALAKCNVFVLAAIVGYVILYVVSIFIACAIKNKAERMLIKNVK